MRELSYRKLSVFFNDLSLLISSAFTMADSLFELERETEDPEERELFSRLAAGVEEGKSLSDVMKETGSFPEYSVRMVASGERSGRLEEVTASLCRYYDRQEELRLLVSSALMKPLILLFLLAMILGLFMAAVLPLLSGVCRELSGDAGPYITASYIVGGIALAVILGVLVYVAVLFMRTKNSGEGGSIAFLLSKTRLTRKLSDLFSLSQFMTDFTTRFAGGLPEDQAFAEAAAGVADDALRSTLENCAKRLEEGISLGTTVYEAGIFPPVCNHLILAGVRAGTVEKALTQVSDYLYTEEGNRTEELVRQVEPSITGFFTVAVGLSLMLALLPLIGVLTSIG